MPGCFETFPRQQPSSSGADFLGAGSVASGGRLSVASQLRLASPMEGISGCSEARSLLGIASVRGSQQLFPRMSDRIRKMRLYSRIMSTVNGDGQVHCKVACELP